MARCHHCDTKKNARRGLPFPPAARILKGKAIGANGSNRTMAYVVIVWRNGGSSTINGGELLGFYRTLGAAIVAAQRVEAEEPPTNAQVYKVV